jgi:Cu-Zn family superoxide dismutase
VKHLFAAAMLAGGLGVATSAHAADLQAEMRLATPTGPGGTIGTVTISEGSGGAVFRIGLKGLPPGTHGFHVHENASCAPGMANGQPVPAGGAGGHLDPAHTGHHEGPTGHGHLGDLPVLTVAQDGAAQESLTAPAIKNLAQVRGHALMIHAGGDNYSDTPAPLGGGGARIACGVIE